MGSAIEFVVSWWKGLNEDNRTLLLAVLILSIFGVVVYAMIDDWDVKYWASLIVSGLISYFFGYHQGIHGTTDNGSETIKVFGFKIDPIFKDQIVICAITVIVISLDRRALLDLFIDGLTKPQIIGVILLVSRLIFIILQGLSPFYGRWGVSVYVLSALLILTPYIVQYSLLTVNYDWLGIVIPIIVGGLVALFETDRISKENVFNLDEWLP